MSDVEGRRREGKGSQIDINKYFSFPKKGPPKMNPRREKFVKFNSTLRVNCHAKGFPKPEVKWTKDGKLLDTTNKLTITDMSYGDAGQYTCSANNSEGKNEAAFQVIVTGKCQFTFSLPVTLFIFSSLFLIFSSFLIVCVNSMPRSS